MSQSENRDLWSELRRLPGGRASAGFTARVLAGLDSRRPARSRRRAGLLAAAAMLLVVAALAGLALRTTTRAEAQRKAQTEEMRMRQRSLAAELEELRALVAEDAPVLHLGGDERVEMVLDLRPLAQKGAGRQARPAVYQPTESPPQGGRQR